MRRVIVTGVGIVSAFGVGKSSFYAGLSGRAVLRPCHDLNVERFPALPILHAARIPDFDPTTILGRKGLRTLARETVIFMAAAALACQDADLDPVAWQRSGSGIVTGTMYAGLADYMEFATDSLIFGPERVNPTQGPQTGFNAPASQLAIRFGAEAANLTITSGYCSGLDALAYAADFLRDGRADVLLAGGVDVLAYFPVLSLLSAGAIAAGEAPSGGPFDARRSRAFAGEAAAVLVLEEEGKARERRAPRLAEIAGAGSAFAPSLSDEGLADAAARAMRQALGGGTAGAVVASASGDARLDACEARAFSEVLDREVWITAVKGATGECLGAGGALQAAVAVRSAADGWLPATARFRIPDPDLPPLRISRAGVAVPLAPVLVHSLDPQGTASALLLTRPGALA